MKTVTMRNILLISFCIILFVLQDWFQQHLEVFQYADELFAIRNIYSDGCSPVPPEEA